MERDAITVEGFDWDANNISHLHDGTTPDDVEAVLRNAPQFFVNLPGRSATHVMVGPRPDGVFFFVAIGPTLRAGVWRPITAWRWHERLARRIYKED